ncbi:MAG: 30S ribosomal protein S8 [Patescibacteria group bacterium]
MVNHTVSDFVTRIKNASKARRRELVAPYTRISRDIAKVLAKEGFLEDIKEQEAEGRKVLSLKIKYNNRIPVITDTKIISKPSYRVYSGSSNLIQTQKKGMFTIILSTSKGIMTGDEAQKNKIGGEVLFRIW